MSRNLSNFAGICTPEIYYSNPMFNIIHDSYYVLCSKWRYHSTSGPYQPQTSGIIHLYEKYTNNFWSVTGPDNHSWLWPMPVAIIYRSQICRLSKSSLLSWYSEIKIWYGGICGPILVRSIPNLSFWRTLRRHLGWNQARSWPWALLARGKSLLSDLKFSLNFSSSSLVIRVNFLYT